MDPPRSGQSVPTSQRAARGAGGRLGPRARVVGTPATAPRCRRRPAPGPLCVLLIVPRAVPSCTASGQARAASLPALCCLLSRLTARIRLSWQPSRNIGATCAVTSGNKTRLRRSSFHSYRRRGSHSKSSSARLRSGFGSRARGTILTGRSSPRRTLQPPPHRPRAHESESAIASINSPRASLIPHACLLRFRRCCAPPGASGRCLTLSLPCALPRCL